MTTQQVKATMLNVKIECKTCHDLLVEGLTNLYTLHINLKPFGNNEAKQTPKDVHNYNKMKAFEDNDRMARGTVVAG